MKIADNTPDKEMSKSSLYMLSIFYSSRKKSTDEPNS